MIGLESENRGSERTIGGGEGWKTLETSIMPLFYHERDLTCERAVGRGQITWPRKGYMHLLLPHKTRGRSCGFYDSLFARRRYPERSSSDSWRSLAPHKASIPFDRKVHVRD